MKSQGEKVLLYGGSGHAKVIIDCLRDSGYVVQGIFDDNPALKSMAGVEFIGPYSPGIFPALPIIISIGNNVIRKKIAQSVSHTPGLSVHPSVLQSPSAQIGQGSVLMHGAILQADVQIGVHCIINTGASVDHDCVIDDYVHISPHTTLCGNVTVGEGSHIGAGATIIQGIKIGRWVTVGAGTVIIRDVPDYAVIVGNPGRIIKIKPSAL
jgi:sugar O-acyltransferase (sialic acid O-acetyltransferase NeuD family)